MSSPASIAKHPIHPMLIVFPIGLWIFSLVCDMIYLGTKNPVWASTSLYAMAGGLVGALLAAVPGFIDLLSMNPSRAKRIGIWHMSLNLIIVLVFAINFALRISGVENFMIPFTLSIVAVLMLSISGWLGGELVYVHGMAVEANRPGSSGERRP